jgi:hypothetical protein
MNYAIRQRRWAMFGVLICLCVMSAIAVILSTAQDQVSVFQQNASICDENQCIQTVHYWIASNSLGFFAEAFTIVYLLFIVSDQKTPNLGQFCLFAWSACTIISAASTTSNWITEKQFTVWIALQIFPLTVTLVMLMLTFLTVIAIIWFTCSSVSCSCIDCHKIKAVFDTNYVDEDSYY